MFTMVVLCDTLQYYPKLWKNVYIVVLVFVFILSPTSQESTNCTYKLRSQTYDLSGLAQQPWSVKISDSEYAVITLCGKNHENPCGAAGVCITDKHSVKLHSAGDIMTVKETNLNNTDRILVSFEGNGTSANRTDITFICSDKIGEPQVLEIKTGYLSLLWNSIAACPIQDQGAHISCNQSLPGGLNFINLQALRRKLYYTTNYNGHQYFVNLCGGIVPSGICGTEQGNITVCDIEQSSNKTTVLGLASKQVVATENGIAIEYKSKGKLKRPSARIEILCNTSVEREKLSVKAITNVTHIFELESPLGCITGPIDCKAFDINNYEYDLSVLRDSQRTVSAFDQRPGHNGSVYYISVCRPLNLTIDKNCSGGVSVCKKSGQTYINLGSLSSRPQVNNEQISIVYSGGSLCNNNSHRYSTVINFICAKTDSDPTLQSVSSDCVYTFIWSTRAACPVVNTVGQNCRVQDKVMGYDFDFSQLRSSNDYVMHNQDGQFRINICGSLQTPCARNSSASVCFTDNGGVEHAIGESATTPHYDDGRLSFVLHGDKCNSSNETSTVNIIFTCSHGPQNQSTQPEYLLKDGCKFYFIWKTTFACIYHKTFECKATDDEGETYDLSPLSLPDYNYVIMQSANGGGFKKYFINVCRSVLFGHDIKCRSLTGVCLYDLREPNRQKSFTSLGEASDLTYNKAKKSLELVYSNGDLCTDKTSPESNIKSIITFACDVTDKGSSSPVLTKENLCVHEFMWKTKYACRKTDGPKRSNNCRAYISYMSIEFDFSPLAKEEHTITNSHNETLRLAACRSLIYAPNTTKGAGICLERKNGDCESLGAGNSNLIIDNMRLYLNYSNGAECGPNQKKNTVIEFICGEDNSGPRYVDSPSNCTYIIMWATELACKRNVPCIAEAPTRTIDLSLLKNNENNYNVSVNGSIFFINVCRSLLPTEGLGCYGGSAACKADFQTKDNWTSEVSLGYPHFRPEAIKDRVVLKYFSGSRCPNTIYRNYSTSISFICDHTAGLGGPRFTKLNADCQYEFSWNTSVVCEDYQIDVTDASERNFTNKQNNNTIDLKPLCNKHLQVNNFSIKMCGESTLCSVHKIKEASQISYGTANSLVFNYSFNETRIFMQDGDECEAVKTEKYAAVVRIQCGDDGNDHLSIAEDLDCRVEFVLKTKAGCYIRVPSAPPSKHTVPTSRSNTSVAGVVFGMLFALGMCMLMIYFRKAENRNWCRSKLYSIFNRRHQGQFHYSMSEDNLSSSSC